MNLKQDAILDLLVLVQAGAPVSADKMDKAVQQLLEYQAAAEKLNEIQQHIIMELGHKVEKIDEKFVVMHGDDVYGYKPRYNWETHSDEGYVFEDETAAWKKLIDLIKEELEGC